MPKFVIYDERAYIVEAADDDAAIRAYYEMSDEEARQYEVEGGGIHVEAAH